jgi:hypothetical protein
MGIEQLSDEQLDTFESNYRKAKKTEGGKYSLSEILLEKLRRKPDGAFHAFNTRVSCLAELAQLETSADGDFRFLADHLHPNPLAPGGRPR